MELILLVVSLLAWALALAGFGGVLELAGRWSLGLYEFFALAAFAGWLAGNVFVYRSRQVPAAARKGLFVVYFLCPPGFLYLIRAMAPLTQQAIAPLAGVYAWGIFMLFFLVPVSFRARGGETREKRSGERGPRRPEAGGPGAGESGPGSGRPRQ